MNIESKQLAISILAKFCGVNKAFHSQSFSPKKYAKANRALKDCLSASTKWNTKVLTSEDAKKFGKPYLAGDFIATNIEPIKTNLKTPNGTCTTVVFKNMLDIHLRADDIKSAHKSKLSLGMT